MARSLLHTTRFKIIFVIAWCCWSVLHAFVLYWFGYSWNAAVTDSAISNLLLFGISILVTMTLQYYLPQKNKHVYLLALCAILTGIWVLITRSLLMIFTGPGNIYTEYFSLSIHLRMVIAFLIIGCTALLSVLWYTLQDQQEFIKRQTEAEKLSKDAELYKLRQQLQPHFLFNSLNSIHALVMAQPQKAREMIRQLSDFLRGTLKKEENTWNSLDEELHHLQLYLDIEKVRFGHRLTTEITNTTTGLQLPALLLQPVVENAIKFGLYDTTGDITITIDAHEKDGLLEVIVSNPFDPETTLQKKGTGFGLTSVQRRLYLIFARHDLLKTAVKDQLFITTILIPQPHDQSAHN